MPDPRKSTGPHAVLSEQYVAFLAEVDRLKAEVARLSARNGRLMAENMARCTERRLEMEEVAAQRDAAAAQRDAVVRTKICPLMERDWVPPFEANGVGDEFRRFDDYDDARRWIIDEAMRDISATGLPGDGGGEHGNP